MLSKDDVNLHPASVLLGAGNCTSRANLGTMDVPITYFQAFKSAFTPRSVQDLLDTATNLWVLVDLGIPKEQILCPTFYRNHMVGDGQPQITGELLYALSITMDDVMNLAQNCGDDEFDPLTILHVSDWIAYGSATLSHIVKYDLRFEHLLRTGLTVEALCDADVDHSNLSILARELPETLVSTERDRWSRFLSEHSVTPYDKNRRHRRDKKKHRRARIATMPSGKGEARGKSRPVASGSHHRQSYTMDRSFNAGRPSTYRE